MQYKLTLFIELKQYSCITHIHTLTLHDCLPKYQVVKGHLWDEKIKIIQSK